MITDRIGLHTVLLTLLITIVVSLLLIILILGLDRPIKDLAIKEKKQIKNDLSGKDIEGRQKLTLVSD